ncbi:hypothetical protein D3C83_301330 [compost metagenome]
MVQSVAISAAARSAAGMVDIEPVMTASKTPNPPGTLLTMPISLAVENSATNGRKSILTL